MKFNPFSNKNHNPKTFSFFIEDQRAWIDLIISKAALIFATVIILAALYHLAGDFEELNRKEELEVVSQDMAYTIDVVGSSQYGTQSSEKEYLFDGYGMNKDIFGRMNVSISGEYVSVSYRENEKEIVSAKPLMYKTLAISPEEITNKMLDRYSASGNSTDPVKYPHTCADVSEFLTKLGTKEANLNTSNKVHIVKTLIHCVNNTEVKELEYILVYQ